METRIYMVRHAESPFVFGQEQTRGLSERGMHDARKVAELMANVNIDCMVSSNYTRAVQTVQFLAEAKNVNIIEYEELKERPIKGLNYEAPWEELLAAIEKSFDDLDYALEGGETSREAQKRAIPIIEKLLSDYRGKNIAIGTHGNIMTIIMNYFDNKYGFEFWKSTSKPDIYEMTFSQDLKLQGVKRIWE